MTPEEFKASIERNLKEAEINAEALDRTVGRARESIIEDFINREPYIGVVDGRIVVDRNLANLEIVHYNVINGQYGMQCRMNETMREAGFDVVDEPIEDEDDEDLQELLSIERTSFKDIFEEYADLRNNPYNLSLFRISRIEAEKPLVKTAYEKLGPAKVREMNYHQSNIKRELVKVENATADNKTFLMLDKMLPKQVPIPRSVIKEKLEEVYSELKLKKTAKATEIKKWYDVTEIKKRMNGELVSCLMIVSSKMRRLSC